MSWQNPITPDELSRMISELSPETVADVSYYLFSTLHPHVLFGGPNHGEPISDENREAMPIELFADYDDSRYALYVLGEFGYRFDRLIPAHAIDGGER